MSGYNAKKYQTWQLINKIYSHIADDCPEYWGHRTKPFNGLLFAVEGICAMLARDKFSAEQIAEFWECPVNFIFAVKRIKADTIEEMREEYQECKQLEQRIQNHPSTATMVSEKDAVLALCELILTDYDKIEKEMQK